MRGRRPTFEGTGFAFSTGNFSRCFRSFLSRYRYNLININNGTYRDFVFMAEDDTKKPHMRQCDIKITVPHDNIILFELLDLDLPCGKASIEIVLAQTLNFIGEPAATFCGDYQKDKPDNNFIISSQVAVVRVLVYTFLPSHMLHFRCTALPLSKDHHLQHIKLNECKGYSVTFLTDHLFQSCSFIQLRGRRSKKGVFHLDPLLHNILPLLQLWLLA